MRNCWQESETETETLLLLGRRMPVQPARPPIIMNYPGCIWWRQEEEEEEEKLVIWQSIILIRRKGKERKGGAVMEWDGMGAGYSYKKKKKNKTSWRMTVIITWIDLDVYDDDDDEKEEEDWLVAAGRAWQGPFGLLLIMAPSCFALLCFLVCLSIYSSAAVHNCVPTVRVANNNNNNNNNSPPTNRIV